MMPDDEPIEIPITDTFDLHTFQPRDVRAAVEEYLAGAHARGFRAIRIIHGRGIGVQREIVHKILARTPFVLEFRDAPDRGATLVTLSGERPAGRPRT
jgi:DNA-nicking Smr family endonuclease